MFGKFKIISQKFQNNELLFEVTLENNLWLKYDDAVLLCSINGVKDYIKAKEKESKQIKAVLVTKTTTSNVARSPTSVAHSSGSPNRTINVLNTPPRKSSQTLPLSPLAETFPTLSPEIFNVLKFPMSPTTNQTSTPNSNNNSQQLNFQNHIPLFFTKPTVSVSPSVLHSKTLKPLTSSNITSQERQEENSHRPNLNQGISLKAAQQSPVRLNSRLNALLQMSEADLKVANYQREYLPIKQQGVAKTMTIAKISTSKTTLSKSKPSTPVSKSMMSPLKAMTPTSKATPSQLQPSTPVSKLTMSPLKALTPPSKATPSQLKPSTPVSKPTMSSAKAMTPPSKATPSQLKPSTPVSKLTMSSVKAMTPPSKATPSQLKPSTPVSKSTMSSVKAMTPPSKATPSQLKPSTPVSKLTTSSVKAMTPPSKAIPSQLKPSTPVSKLTTSSVKAMTPPSKAIPSQLKPSTPVSKSTMSSVKAMTPPSKATPSQLKPSTPVSKSTMSSLKAITPTSKTTPSQLKQSTPVSKLTISPSRARTSISNIMISPSQNITSSSLYLENHNNLNGVQQKVCTSSLTGNLNKELLQRRAIVPDTRSEDAKLTKWKPISTLLSPLKINNNSTTKPINKVSGHYNGLPSVEKPLIVVNDNNKSTTQTKRLVPWSALPEYVKKVVLKNTAVSSQNPNNGHQRLTLSHSAAPREKTPTAPSNTILLHGDTKSTLTKTKITSTVTVKQQPKPVTKYSHLAINKAKLNGLQIDTKTFKTNEEHNESNLTSHHLQNIEYLTSNIAKKSVQTKQEKDKQTHVLLKTPSMMAATGGVSSQNAKMLATVISSTLSPSTTTTSVLTNRNSGALNINSGSNGLSSKTTTTPTKVSINQTDVAKIHEDEFETSSKTHCSATVTPDRKINDTVTSRNTVLAIFTPDHSKGLYCSHCDLEFTHFMQYKYHSKTYCKRLLHNPHSLIDKEEPSLMNRKFNNDNKINNDNNINNDLNSINNNTHNEFNNANNNTNTTTTNNSANARTNNTENNNNTTTANSNTITANNKITTANNNTSTIGINDSNSNNNNTKNTVNNEMSDNNTNTSVTTTDNKINNDDISATNNEPTPSKCLASEFVNFQVMPLKDLVSESGFDCLLDKSSSSTFEMKKPVSVSTGVNESVPNDFDTTQPKNLSLLSCLDTKCVKDPVPLEQFDEQKSNLSTMNGDANIESGKRKKVFCDVHNGVKVKSQKRSSGDISQQTELDTASRPSRRTRATEKESESYKTNKQRGQKGKRKVNSKLDMQKGKNQKELETRITRNTRSQKSKNKSKFSVLADGKVCATGRRVVRERPKKRKTSSKDAEHKSASLLSPEIPYTKNFHSLEHTPGSYNGNINDNQNNELSCVDVPETPKCRWPCHSGIDVIDKNCPPNVTSSDESGAPTDKNVDPTDEHVDPTDEHIAPTDKNVAPIDRTVAPTDKNVALPIDKNVAPTDKNVAPIDKTVAPTDKNVAPPIDKNVAPTDKIVAPIDKNVAPIDKIVAPIDTNVAPTNKNVAPIDKHVAPTDKHVAPTDKNVAPIDKNVAPIDKNVTPTDKSIAPTDKNFAPIDKKVASTNKNVDPTDKNVAPIDKNVAPIDKNVTPTDKSIAPTDKNFAPIDKNVAPTNKNVDPTDKNVAPIDEHVAPPDKNVHPTDKNVAPTNKNVAPIDKNVTPTDKSIAPTDKNFAPIDKNVAPTNKNVDPTDKNVAPIDEHVAPPDKNVDPTNKNVAPTDKNATSTEKVIPVTVATEILAPVLCFENSRTRRPRTKRSLSESTNSTRLASHTEGEIDTINKICLPVKRKKQHRGVEGLLDDLSCILPSSTTRRGFDYKGYIVPTDFFKNIDVDGAVPEDKQNNCNSSADAKNETCLVLGETSEQTTGGNISRNQIDHSAVNGKNTDTKQPELSCDHDVSTSTETSKPTCKRRLSNYYESGDFSLDGAVVESFVNTMATLIGPSTSLEKRRVEMKDVKVNALVSMDILLEKISNNKNANASI